jgi:hypothetical protein
MPSNLSLKCRNLLRNCTSPNVPGCIAYVRCAGRFMLSERCWSHLTPRKYKGKFAARVFLLPSANGTVSRAGHRQHGPR